MSTIELRLPPVLHPFAGGRAAITADAQTVAGLLAALHDSHPALAARLTAPDGGLRPYVNLFVDQTHLREAGGLHAPLADGTVLTVLPAVAGG